MEMNETQPVRRARSVLTRAVKEGATHEAPEAPVKVESDRERAARRAAELRNHIGNMDEGSDDFFVPPEYIPDGWSYEWKRKTTVGMEDPAYQVQLARMGWEAVPASRHPSMMPSDNRYQLIERKGMVLMERPVEITDEAKSIEYRKARNQVRQKEEQLGTAPDGTLTRDHAKAKPKIAKSYDAIAIPKD
jgi:hypothetical protein